MDLSLAWEEHSGGFPDGGGWVAAPGLLLYDQHAVHFQKVTLEY
jgi:hypothetical protein